MVVLTVVFLLLIVILMVLIKEWLRRKREGFYVNTKGNADGGDVIYYEGEKSLTFYFDRIAYTVYVPSNRKWEEDMPEWARVRKSEIIERIRTRLGQNWKVVDKSD
jgi:hypothetical protein